MEDSIQDIRYCTRCGWYNHTRRSCYSKHNRAEVEITEDSVCYCLRCGKAEHNISECNSVKNHHKHTIIGSVEDFLGTKRAEGDQGNDLHKDEVTFMIDILNILVSPTVNQ